MSAAPLDQDLLCVHCRYNLRGLLPTADCPECGQAIEESLRGDRLCFADRRWLRRLAWGAQVFPLALVLRLCDIDVQLAHWRDLLIFVLLRLPALIALIGLLLLTTPEPGRVELEQPFSPRLLTRWLGVVILTLEMFPDTWLPPGMLTPWIVALGLMLNAGWVWSGGRYAVQIGERLPRPDLVRQVRWVSRVLAGALVGLSVLSIVTPWVATPHPQNAWPATGWSIQIGGRSYMNVLWLTVLAVPLILTIVCSSIAMLVLVFSFAGRIIATSNEV